MKTLIELKDENLETLIKGHEFVVLDFHALWCPPCLLLSKTIKSLANDYAERVQFIKVNIDQHKQITNTYQVKGIPTLIILHNQKEIARVSGFKTKNNLTAWLDMFISNIEHQ